MEVTAMRVGIAAETCDVVTAIDGILNETKHNALPLPVMTAVSLLRQRTGSKRSDADLRALVAKMAAARGIALEMDTKCDPPR